MQLGPQLWIESAPFYNGRTLAAHGDDLERYAFSNLDMTHAPPGGTETRPGKTRPRRPTPARRGNGPPFYPPARRAARSF